MAHVVAFTDKPGIEGVMEQEVIVPETVGVCVAATPTVSVTDEGEKASVGLATRTVILKIAVTLSKAAFWAVTV